MIPRMPMPLSMLAVALTMAFPSVGLVVRASSSMRTSSFLSVFAAATIWLILRISAANAESPLSSDCSSPMLVMMRFTRHTEAFAAGTKKPNWQRYWLRATVFSITVLPAMLAPVIRQMLRSSDISTGWKRLPCWAKISFT